MSFILFIKKFVNFIFIKGMRRRHMRQRRKRLQRIESYSIYLGLILLAGVLLVSYGFFNNYNTALYIGLPVTIFGSIYGVIHITVFKKV
jgi:uncharacterized membrane protein YiaA